MRIAREAIGCWIVLVFSVAVSAAGNGDLRLVEAVKNQDRGTVRSLLNQQQVDVDATKGDGTTPLVWAAHWDDLDVADLLIRAGANVSAMNDYGVTALWEACNNGSASMVEKLAGAGANLNAPLLLIGETALMRCTHRGDAAAVKSLIAHGADVNAKEEQKGQTALMWALEERRPQVVQVLIEHGADVQARSQRGFTPLLFAARQGDVSSARLLLAKGADLNETTPDGMTPLLVAADSGREAFAIFLLEQGAKVNVADANGLTPLHYALRKGISLLTAVENYGNNYFYRPNMRELVKALLEHGANPNARIKVDLRRVAFIGPRFQLGLAGATPFFLAAATGDVGIMRTLLAKGADPNLATYDGTTPLMVAAGVGRRPASDGGVGGSRSEAESKQALEAVKMLVEQGADVNAVNRRPPAASNPNLDNLRNDGVTAMHGAAFLGATDIIQFLADKGAKLDVMDRFGETPLSTAEGDPNGLAPDTGEPRYLPSAQENAAKLLRKLMGGDVQAKAVELPVVPTSQRRPSVKKRESLATPGAQ